MGETYIGVKFTTLKVGRYIPAENETRELQEWGKRLAESGFAPPEGKGFSGNLSMRTAEGFLITRTGADLSALQKEDFVEVIGVNTKKKEVRIKGEKEPSSETFMHAGIYAQRRDVHAIFHFHDRAVLSEGERLHLPMTAVEQPYGTEALMEEVAKILGKNRYLLMKNHGCITLGKNCSEAGEEALRIHRLIG